MSIGIVGTGISGLQLALHLQSHGVDATVYAPESGEAIAAGRLPNCVVRWAATLDREAELGVDVGATNHVAAIHVRVAGAQPLAFCGHLERAVDAMDFRLYLPRLLAAFEARGGAVVVGPRSAADLASLAATHDLVAVAAGRDGLGGVFPRDPNRSPHHRPARHITAGLYDGVAWPDPVGVEFTIVPGAGEIFQVCFMSAHGPISAVSVEAIPGGPLDLLRELDPHASAPTFSAAVLETLRSFAPWLHERVTRDRFALHGAADVLQGRLVPTVRRAWVPIADTGKFAVAIGDAWILNDPIAAQGANLGSRSAFVLAEAIEAGGPYDESFCRGVEARLWDAAEAPTMLSNALLEPPGPAVIDLLVRATHDQGLADRFVSGFGAPEGILRLLASEPAVT